jgi:hypothetical protein
VALHYASGKAYHLRLTARNLPGGPLRYARLSLEVSEAELQGATPAKADAVVNLTAASMPNRGEVGLFARQSMGTDGEPQRLYVRDFSISR